VVRKLQSEACKRVNKRKPEEVEGDEELSLKSFNVEIG